MAGHPTVGSTFALAHTGFLEPGRPRVVFGLNVGPTPVDLEWDRDRLRFAWMTQGLPEFGPAIDGRSQVATALGLTLADLAPGCRSRSCRAGCGWSSCRCAIATRWTAPSATRPRFGA